MKYKEPKPPYMALWIIKRLSLQHHQQTALGDIEELYYQIFEDRGKKEADNWYRRQAVRSIPFLINNIIYWILTMITNYIKIAFRNIGKNKGYSFINISGLAIGLTVFSLILLWIQDEYSYDCFHENSQNIYRVNIIDNMSSNSIFAGISPAPAAPYLKDNYNEVINSTRLQESGDWKIKTGERIFYESGAFVDYSFFSVFSIPVESGNSGTSFNDPFSIVITKELADKFFKNKEPVGEILNMNDNNNFRVIGVINNIPKNSIFKSLRFFIPLEQLKAEGKDLESWGTISYSSFVQIKNNVNIEDMNRKIANIIKDHFPDYSKVSVYLQSLTDIHLFSENIIGMGGDGNIKNIYIFSIVAVFILFIAYLNFINLTNSRYAKKTKEIGIRKVVGANRSDLIFQVICESLILWAAGLFIAAVMFVLLLPAFNNITAKNIIMQDLNFSIILTVMSLTFFAGIVSGIFPAIFLSGIKPANVLKGHLISGDIKNSKFAKKIMVVMQFSISIFMIICTLIIAKQQIFLKNTNLGYDKNNIIYFPLPGDINQKSEMIKNELMKHPGILNASAVSSLPTYILSVFVGFDWDGKDKNDSGRMNVLYVDNDFFNMMNLKLVDGRGFSKKFSSDNLNFVLNETAANMVDNLSPVNKRFAMNDETGKIAGVVEDFHFRSLHSAISPLVIRRGTDRLRYICVKVQEDNQNLKSTISHMEEVWKKYGHGFEFRHGFLDEDYESMYRSEQRLGRIFNYFTAVAIFVSCLGLLGLAAFETEQKKKDIGMRKILGASISGIIILFVKEFSKWIVTANIIAWPAAYFIMNVWLQNFAFRTEMNLWIFLFSGGAALVIAVITIVSQVIKSAAANPVDSLKQL